MDMSKEDKIKILKEVINTYFIIDRALDNHSGGHMDFDEFLEEIKDADKKMDFITMIIEKSK